MKPYADNQILAKASARLTYYELEARTLADYVCVAKRMSQERYEILWRSLFVELVNGLVLTKTTTLHPDGTTRSPYSPIMRAAVLHVIKDGYFGFNFSINSDGLISDNFLILAKVAA